MPRDTNAFAIETLESRTLMSTSIDGSCAHVDAPATDPGAQGYRTQQMNAPKFQVRVVLTAPQMSRIEEALIRAAIALANQMRGSDAPGAGNHAEAPAAPPAPASEPPTPRLQSLAPSPQRVIADAVIVPPQISTDVAALASSAARQEILATDFSSKVTAATSFVSSAPALVATPIFTSAYSSSVLAWDTIQSNITAIAPAVTDIVTNPALASTVGAVVAPAAKIFNFAEMGSPLAFLGDALASFADESAAVPNVLATAPTSQTAWLVTGLVAAVDAAVLLYYYRTRANRRSGWSSENDPFSRQLVNELDSLEDLN